MNKAEFKQNAYKIVDEIAELMFHVEEFPVLPNVQPNDILKQIPVSPPTKSESLDKIMGDFKAKILPGITHWQHPNFYAYFPANGSIPSLFAEWLTATLGAQCMVWQTSPAAAELEERMMEWLKEIMGLPKHFVGSIQDTASTATLSALLTAREWKSDFMVNQKGFQHSNYRIYCSEETHSSAEKAVKIAGFGKENLVKIKVNQHFDMNVEDLEYQINIDRENGKIPLFVMSTIGTTGSTAVDNVELIGKIAQKYELWQHVDAAFAGTAMLLDEKRHFMKGLELADSYVFNPHKWMMTHFDCSAYYVKSKELLIRTFELLREYLKTGKEGSVNNYRDWGVPLGRRFRALKLWFVMRYYGVEGLQNIIRNHIKMANDLKVILEQENDIEILAPVHFNMICFRFFKNNYSLEHNNEFNANIMQTINSTGKAFFSHTKLNGKYTIRWMIGQTNVTENHVKEIWKLMREIADKLV